MDRKFETVDERVTEERSGVPRPLGPSPLATSMGLIAASFLVVGVGVLVLALVALA